MNKIILILILSAAFVSCKEETKPVKTTSQETSQTEGKDLKKADHKLFHATLRKHLKATADKDIETLRSLMAPDGLMYLMRPSTEVVYTTDKYLKYHEAWFQDEKWSISTKITDSEVGTDMGAAIVELTYNEPERNGKPYWNKMTLSYMLKKYDDGAWYVISDHSSSVRKSTSNK